MDTFNSTLCCLVPKGFLTEEFSYITSILYISFTLLSFCFYPTCNYTVFFYILLLLILGLLASLYSSKYSGRFLNAMFQITWFYAVATLTIFNTEVLGLLFLIGHLPIIFLPHLGLFAKLLVLVTSFILGVFYAFVFSYYKFPVDILIGVLSHMFMYELLRPWDKKFNLKIIN